jgi:hypothetical protein
MTKLTNQLTPWYWTLLEKPPVAQLLKNFPTFYGTRRFIIVFTRALHWSLSSARSVQSMSPQPIFLEIHLTVTLLPTSRSSYWSFSSGFSTKILYAFSFGPMHTTCPAHLILDLIILIMLGEDYELRNSSFCSYTNPLSLLLSSVQVLS